MLAVAILAVLGAGGSFHQGSQHQGGRVVPGPRFETLPPGWHAFDDRPNLLNSGGGSAMLIGTAWRFQQSNPGGWGSNVPRGSVGVEVDLWRSPGGGASTCGFPVIASRAFPATSRLRLSASLLGRGPSDDNPQTADFRYSATVRRMYKMLVIVEYGSPKPSAAVRGHLAGALRSVVLPVWPAGC